MIELDHFILGTPDLEVGIEHFKHLTGGSNLGKRRQSS